MTRVPILTYHRVALPSKETRVRGLCTGPRALRRQLEFLTRHGYAFCDFDDVAAAQRGERSLPARPVLLTFDDGHRDNVTAGLPILREFGAKATVFVVAGDVGKRGVRWDEAAETEPFELFDWDEARRLDAAGVRIEVHGWTHRHMDRVPPDEVEAELVRARSAVAAEIGREPVALAYPFGAHDAGVRAAAGRAGFTFACTVRDGVASIATDDALALPRISVKGYRWIHSWRFRRRLR